MMWATNRDKFIDRTYISLEDLLIDVYDEVPGNLLLGEEVTDLIKDCYNYFIQEVGTGSNLASAQVNKLFCSYLFPRYHEQTIGYYDGEDNQYHAKQSLVCSTWLTKFANVVNRTYNKYIKLINLYDAEKDNLMNDITVTNTSRYNDTPQNGGAFTDDSYTTNYTEATQTSPAATKMARLEEIRDGYDDLYTAWADEFKKIFYAD